MKLWNLSLMGIALIISTSTNAALIDNGVFTTDTRTGLDWLDLTETDSLSYNDVSSQLGSGGQFEGWMYATTNDVTGLFDSAGGNGIYTSGFTTDNYGVVIPLLDLWGNIIGQYNSPEYNDYNSMFIMRNNLGDITIGQAFEVQFEVPMVVLTADSGLSLGPDGISSTMGSALIRVSSVPTPAAAWLFGSGLIGLIGIAKRKKA